MSSRASARSTSSKLNIENRMARRREREYDHQTRWNEQVRYYKSWEKTNNKFEEWTSPRYYQENNQLLETMKKESDRKENLEKRKTKLKKLLDEEDRTYQIEIMARSWHPQKTTSEIPTELLTDINLNIKLAENDRKKHEAELALYRHWRNNNHILRDQERIFNARDIKLSWLDQQVEKRLERERAEEECRRLLAEREKVLNEVKDAEEQAKQVLAEKNQKLKTDLEQQMEELRLKNDESEKLRKHEEEENKKLLELETIEKRQKLEEKRRKECELVIENLKQHKLKLQKKAADVRVNLEKEKEFIACLLESEVAERIENEKKKQEVKQTMNQFLKFARDQQELERRRQQHFDFVFDSESASIYEKQKEIWLHEQKAREDLLANVVATVKEQIEDQLKKNKEKQIRTLEDRQETLKKIEEYERSIKNNLEEEKMKRDKWKHEIEEQLKEKKFIEDEAKHLEQKRVDLELQNVRKEEERLRREIIELQRKQIPIRHARTRILF